MLQSLLISSIFLPRDGGRDTWTECATWHFGPLRPADCGVFTVKASSARTRAKLLWKCQRSDRILTKEERDPNNYLRAQNLKAPFSWASVEEPVDQKNEKSFCPTGQWMHPKDPSRDHGITNPKKGPRVFSRTLFKPSEDEVLLWRHFKSAGQPLGFFTEELFEVQRCCYPTIESTINCRIFQKSRKSNLLTRRVGKFIRSFKSLQKHH